MDSSHPELSPQTLMSRVLELVPGAQRALFRRYHIGGCSSCAFQPSETLETLCRRNNNLDVAEVIAHLLNSHQEDELMLMAPTDLSRLMQSGAALKLLDVRTREEWDAVHIAGAQRLSQETMQDILSHWPREDLLVIYDHQGRQGLDAAAYFQGQGFKNVKCLRGGIDAWSLQVDPQLPRYQLQSGATGEM